MGFLVELPRIKCESAYAISPRQACHSKHQLPTNAFASALRFYGKLMDVDSPLAILENVLLLQFNGAPYITNSAAGNRGHKNEVVVRRHPVTEKPLHLSDISRILEHVGMVLGVHSLHGVIQASNLASVFRFCWQYLHVCVRIPQRLNNARVFLRRIDLLGTPGMGMN